LSFVYFGFNLRTQLRPIARSGSCDQMSNIGVKGIHNGQAGPHTVGENRAQLQNNSMMMNRAQLQNNSMMMMVGGDRNQMQQRQGPQVSRDKSNLPATRPLDTSLWFRIVFHKDKKQIRPKNKKHKVLFLITLRVRFEGQRFNGSRVRFGGKPGNATGSKSIYSVFDRPSPMNDAATGKHHNSIPNASVAGGSH
jgi:hypothetical protein